MTHLFFDVPLLLIHLGERLRLMCGIAQIFFQQIHIIWKHEINLLNFQF